MNRIRPETNERKLYITLTTQGEQLKRRALSVPDAIRGCLNLSQEEMVQLKALLDKALNTMESSEVIY